MFARGRLVGALALCVCANAAAETHDDAADSMAKVLAGVTFLKELGNFQNAQHAMSIFGKVADSHITEARCAASCFYAGTCLVITLYVSVVPCCFKEEDSSGAESCSGVCNASPAAPVVLATCFGTWLTLYFSW